MKTSRLKIEAKEFGISKLEEKTKLSRSHIYGILNGRIDPSIETFQRLLEPLGLELILRKKTSNSKIEPEITDECIIVSLAKHGAPLISPQKSDTSACLDIDMTLISALPLGRKKAQINAILPYFISLNWKKLNWKEIEKQTHDKRYLAYLLNLVFHFTNDLEISDELQTLRSNIGHSHRTERLIKRGKLSEFERKRLKHTDNIVARSWKFLTADSLIDVEERFKKWKSATA